MGTRDCTSQSNAVAPDSDADAPHASLRFATTSAEDLVRSQVSTKQRCSSAVSVIPTLPPGLEAEIDVRGAESEPDRFPKLCARAECSGLLS